MNSNFDINNLVMDNIKQLYPYLSARKEYRFNQKAIFLDANENSFGSPLSSLNSYHRYPDPLQIELKHKIAEIKNISYSKIFLGNGSDEIIDIIYRIFSQPMRDNSIIFPPTYGMYEVSGKIHGVDVIKVSLIKETYQLNIKQIIKNINSNSKIIFICSPNNPTGNNLKKEDIETIIEKFNGIIVLDEAYIDFSNQESFYKKIDKYPNLIILHTLSKSWGLAGLRIGIAIASEAIIQWMNKIKSPYNINKISQQLAIQALENKDLFFYNLKKIISERNYMSLALQTIPIVHKVYPSDANFLLVQLSCSTNKFYKYLLKHNIIVRDRSQIALCNNCLRITIGTNEENKYLIKQMQQYEYK
ncbi:histidinol-phosphate transaminase [Blattabacterium cuenoti]|uniref:histidinol-phosphate transaminase n=1 Tax=Blattabacterium cuenoti TaxID=1653831 RepID=UPI00163BAB52|nr:histidinol-phosphate transaminase [Blattabacterium cuenoti]